MKKGIKLTTFLLTFLTFSQVALAFAGDMSINSENIRFSHNNFLEGKTTRIYATVVNHSNKDLLGIVRFFDNGKQIGGDQAISIFNGKTDDVFIDWVPAYGAHNIAVKIFPWEPQIDNPANNWIVSEIFAVQDTDHDGIPNTKDPDDDNDGINDELDAFPLNPKEQYDTDGDGKGDNSDPDDDNDGVNDDQDEMPLNPNETLDTDKDGIGNNEDTDDDGDGLLDLDEKEKGTDPLNPDTDGDGVNDKEDAFPLNPAEQYDTDKDGIGNNEDTDDDGDNIPDIQDDFPLNKGPVIKLKNSISSAGLFSTKLFDASPSYDEDGKIKNYTWLIDGKEMEGNFITYNFKETGKHDVKLTVTDDQGQTTSKDFQINVVNTKFYTQIALTLLVILLALTLYFKYIAQDKKTKS